MRVVTCNYMYILDFLSDEDNYQFDPFEGKELHFDYSDLPNNTATQLAKSISLSGSPIEIRYTRIFNEAMLNNLFDEVVKDIKNGKIPILHFECHGDEARGIELPNLHKHISWESLIKQLIRVNKKIHNSLLVVVAGCHSNSLISKIQFQETSPFGCYIGSKSVTYEPSIKEFQSFYKVLFQTNDIQKAYLKINKDFIAHYSYDICTYNLIQPIVLNYLGKDKYELIEYLTSHLNKNSIYGLTLSRKEAKYRLKNLDKFYLKSGKRFLHGNSPLPYSDAIALAKKLKDKFQFEASYNSKFAKALEAAKSLPKNVSE
ncbi:TPA: hypothetical protein ACS7XF_000767 [Providencia alcalifaciens]